MGIYDAMRRPEDYILVLWETESVSVRRGDYVSRRWCVYKGWVLERYFDTFRFLSAMGGVDEIRGAIGVFKSNEDAKMVANKLNSEIVKEWEPDLWVCWKDVYERTHSEKGKRKLAQIEKRLVNV